MKEFEPLRESSGSPFERALLRSADRDVPSSRAFAKTAAALGVSATVIGAAGNTSAAVGGTGATVTFWVTIVKPLLLGATGGLVVAVGAHQLSRSSEATKPAAPVVSASPAVASAPVRAVSTGRSALDEVVPSEAAPSVPSAAGRPIPTVAPRAVLETARPTAGTTPSASETTAEIPKEAPKAPAAASASIASEIVTIDRARQSLRDGHPSDALHELDVYRLAWPSGVLSTEAAVLRIEAHLALGDRTSGIRAARAFLSANPSGRYATRVRALFKPSELE